MADQLDLYGDRLTPHAPTLTEALAALGYTHRAPLARAPQSHREIVDAAGRVVFTGDWQGAWTWLADGRPVSP